MADDVAVACSDLFTSRVQATPLPLARSVPPDLSLLASLFNRVVTQGRYSNFGALYHEYASALGAELACNASPLLFANATIALTTVLRALRVSGEVITTPFSFAASAHAIDWAGARPVFCDIDPSSLTLDPDHAEAAITRATTAILAVHIYGQPCDVDGLQQIATRHGLPLIYDAAHAFGTCIDGRPLHHWGDATIYSLHASKLTHAGEGGVLVTRDHQLHQTCEAMQNFGIVDENTVAFCGSNGKLSEASAALGLAVLPGVAEERRARQQLRDHYRHLLAALDGVTLFELSGGATQSEQYLVIRVQDRHAPASSGARDAVFNLLRRHNVLARRYFHPLCSDFPHYRMLASAAPSNLPVSVRAAREMLCLPFHGGVSASALHDMLFLINEALDTHCGTS